MKRKKQKNKAENLLLIISILAAIFLGLVLSGNLYVDSLLNKTTRSKKLTDEEAMVNQSVKDQVKDHKIINIALFGSDNQEWNEWTNSEMERSDATKIISLDYDEKKIKITSLQRDTLIYIPEPYNDYDKLNHAHWRGGPELAIQTINMNFDMDITQYVGFSFEALEKLVDLVGGIDIYLTAQEINQKDKDLEINGEAGTYHLNGHQAMMYCRIRMIDDDYYRMKRQNNVIMAVISELRNENPIRLLSIADEMLRYVETNLTNDQIKNYITTIVSFDLKHIEQMQIPSEGMNSILKTVEYNGFNPLYIMKNYQKLVKDLHKFIYEEENYEPSTRVMEIESEIYKKFCGS
ncbi:LCP family protein [Holdemania massiliensis]|uniref:LCP family protein n=1 Tax=Holdemania massiliensis TaxID=1468449 RepID=UPI0012AEEA65|nr:LCP family protein [Holdemania massiliensis]